MNGGAASDESGRAAVPVEPPCDVCFQSVRFDPRTRRFWHTVPTSCQGIDGVVIAVPRRERDDLSRTWCR